METTGNIPTFRVVAAAAVLALLSACAMQGGTAAKSNDRHRTASAAPEKPAPGGQEITLASTVERHRLSISYSLSSVRHDREDILRLTLLFRNLTDADRAVSLHIVVTDAQGRQLRPLTPQSTGIVSQMQDVQWLRSSFDIPAQGIEMGEQVYRAKEVAFPLNISIRIGKDHFEFTANKR